MHRATFSVVLLLWCSVGNLSGAYAQSTTHVPTTGQVNTLQERQKLTEAIVKSATDESYATPIRTSETFISGLIRGDFRRYLGCMSRELKKRVTGEDMLSEEKLRLLDSKFKEAGYRHVVLHSLTLSLEGQVPAMNVIVSSERGEFRIKEQMDVELVNTEDGWKFSRMDSKILGREPVEHKP